MKEGKCEIAFWRILNRIGLFVAIPYTLGDILSRFFQWRYASLGIMFTSGIILWMLFRELKIIDLKKGRKR